MNDNKKENFQISPEEKEYLDGYKMGSSINFIFLNNNRFYSEEFISGYNSGRLSLLKEIDY